MTTIYKPYLDAEVEYRMQRVRELYGGHRRVRSHGRLRVPRRPSLSLPRPRPRALALPSGR
jgi:hypothetical protein